MKNIHLAGTTAAEFWLSAQRHREQTLSEWEKARAGNPNAVPSLDMRLILKSEIEAQGLRSRISPLPTGNASRDVEASTIDTPGASSLPVLATHKVSPATYRVPTILEVVESASAGFAAPSIACSGRPSAAKDEMERLCNRYSLALPLKLAVGSAACRSQSALFDCATSPSKAPAASYIPIRRGLKAASPELCLLQAAKELGDDGFVRLAVLCARMFSIYSVDPSAPLGLLTRTPLTTPRKCLAFLGRCGYSRSQAVSNLKRAISIACPLCASPPEIMTSILLNCPRNLGGYGLGPVACNQIVDVSAYYGGRRSQRRALDMYLPRAGCAVEYLGVNGKVFLPR